MRPFCRPDSLQSSLASAQRNPSIQAVRASHSDARAWSFPRTRRRIVVLERDQCQSGDDEMSLKMMERNVALKGAARNSNQALWEKGGFTEIAAFMRQSG